MMAEGGRDVRCQDVKSTAIVKYAAIEMPAHFQQLQQNTDLKQPPANWLHGNSKWESYLRNFSCGKNHFFSSIKMGHCYPELTGEIDVVSEAENIKKLLKIPYSKCHVSMMVHRVGNTLLLDDFDIHRHLLRQQKKDWVWLRKFYYETIARSMQGNIKDQMHVIKKNKTRDHLQNRNMFSKFLYYSIGETDNDSSTAEPADKSTNETALRNSSSQLIPDPFTQAENTRPEHLRTQEWTFEDIRMLVGTDLPIFGGGTHPCISLKLRDMREPINVLTGLDYWLDNLICNVPELAMCYHLDGIVQSYELIKTEDIPKLSKSSEFSPGVIKDVAQNILSFLKSNATKEGHTYWLFKGHGDDIVKLYDLTTLCADVQDDLSNNPFTVPVGMLLYRVARNMRTKHGRKKSGTIRTLLKNCLQLLDKDLHSQIVTSAQFLLSDLYISDNIFSPEVSPDSSDIESDNEEENIQDDLPPPTEASTTSIDVQTLCLAGGRQKQETMRQHLTRYPPVSGNREERCTEALKHVTLGLSCLDQSVKKGDSSGNRGDSTNIPEEYQATCNPNTAIPMHYSPLKAKSTNPTTGRGASSKTCSNSQKQSKTDSKDSVLADHAERCTSCDQSQSEACECSLGSSSQVSVFNRRTLPPGSWHTRSKSLLLRKAAVGYYGMAEKHLSVKKYGLAWKCVNTALHCFSTLELLSPQIAEANQSLLGSILSVAGDLHLMMSHDAPAVASQTYDFVGQCEQDEAVLASARRELQQSAYDWLTPFSADVRKNLERSCRCYRIALKASCGECAKPELTSSVGKRLGNCLNELGVHYMNTLAKTMAAANGEDPLEPAPDLEDLSQKSCQCFEEGIIQFKDLKDSLNVALLLSNQGRLKRLVAQNIRQALSRGSAASEFTPREAQTLAQAQECYEKAKDQLGARTNNPEIWDSIVWELSSTCFTMATLLQDHAPLTTKAQEQVEAKVVVLMKKALQFLDVSAESPRHVQCQYRAASIHHRLASLYHNAYRNQTDSKLSRQLRVEAEDNYTQAVHIFDDVSATCELLRVQLERVALYEYQLPNQTSPVTRVRTLQLALGVLTDCRSTVDSLAHQVVCEGRAVTQNDGPGLEEEGDKLIGILISRLQFIAHNLVKNTATIKSKKSSPAANADAYKTIYAMVLKSGLSDSSIDLPRRCRVLSDVLTSVYNDLHRDLSTLSADTPNKSPAKIKNPSSCTDHNSLLKKR